MGKKQKTTDWTLQHHDGVSEKTMIGRPARPPMKIAREPEAPIARFPDDDQAIWGPRNPEAGIMYEVSIEVTVDGKLEDRCDVTEETHTPVQAMVRALRGLADSLESAAAG